MSTLRLNFAFWLAVVLMATAVACSPPVTGVQGAATTCSTGGRAGTGGRVGTGGAVSCAGGAGGAAGAAGGGGVGGVGGAIAGTGGAPGTGGAAMGGNGGQAGAAGAGGSAGAGGMLAGTGGVAMGTGGALGGAGGSAGGPAGGGGAGGTAGAGGSAGSGGTPPACWGSDFGGIEPFYNYDHYARLMSPVATATFFAPATIRMWGHAPDDGNTFAPSMRFYVDNVLAGTAMPTQTDYYQLDVTGVAAGCHDLFVRATFTDGTTADSVHVPISVVTPTQTTVVNLTSDVVLSGAVDLAYVGTPGNRILLTSSNGSKIVSVAGWTGKVVLRYVDIVGLGSLTTINPATGPSLSVATANAAGVVIDNVTFDRSGPVAIQANGSAPVSVTNTTLQPNMLILVDGSPNLFNSQPVITFSGSSTATKVFSGNNIGLSFVYFDHTNNWLVGAPVGGTSAQGNVSIGVRAGYQVIAGSNFEVRGNVSYHRYAFGGSQGQNGAGIAGLVEHNFFRGGSWLLDGFSGEARYNLLMDGTDEAFFRGCRLSTIHHNVFATVGYARINNPAAGIRDCSTALFTNNTVDAGGTILAVAPDVAGNLNGRFTTLWNGTGGTFFDTGRDPEQLTAHSNVFAGFGFFNPMAVFAPNSLVATANAGDYNAWWNPDAMPLANVQHYAQPGNGAHDTASLTMSPFAGVRMVPAQIADGALWQRAMTTGQVLSVYRAIYAPGMMSPLTDAGDPAGPVGNDIGAIGSGVPDPADLFGTFGP